jgi:hypothetical protein
LKKAVEASEKYEAQSGEMVPGWEKIDKALTNMLNATAGLEQSEYGGASLGADMDPNSTKTCSDGSSYKSCKFNSQCKYCLEAERSIYAMLT